MIVEEFNNGGKGGVDEGSRGEEMWEDREGKVDILVGGVGRGGRVRGVGGGLKKDKWGIEVVGVEGEDCGVL